MAVNEGLKPLDGTSVPTDPNVRIPDSVKAAGASAEEIHARHYPRGDTPVAPNKDGVVQPAQQLEAAHTPQPQAHQGVPSAEEQEAARAAALAAQAANGAQQMEQHPAPSAADQNVTAEEWRHRFLSMQGRFNAKTRELAGMEETMTQLGVELTRTQALLSTAQGTQHAGSQAPSDTNHANVITDADREAYGEELIDLARRAATEVLTPEIQRLRADNASLTARVQNTGRRELFATLDQRLPNWRQINVAPQFKAWLRLPNIYTGQLRGNMLKAAVDGAEAPKVLALFSDFLAEAQATGQQVPTAQNQQQDLPVPRTSALDLETLAAPGRARPASGDTQVPVEKPTFTRAQISKFYDDSRKGLYAGREAEYRQTEADMQSAQREGRIR